MSDFTDAGLLELDDLARRLHEAGTELLQTIVHARYKRGTVSSSAPTSCSRRGNHIGEMSHGHDDLGSPRASRRNAVHR